MINYSWGKIIDGNKFIITQNYFSKIPKDPESINFNDFIEKSNVFEGDD